MRLDVAMNDWRLLSVNIVESVEQRLGPCRHLPAIEGPVTPNQQREEVGARNELHHQKLPSAFDEMITHPGQRGVAQSRHHSRLALELLAQYSLLFAEEGLFDRHRGVAQVDRFSFVDRAHPAARQQADDPITPLQERAIS